MIPVGIIGKPLAAAAANSAILVVADKNSLTGGDLSVKSRLETQHDTLVTVVSDEDAAPSTVGYTYCVITGTVDDVTLGTKYTDYDIPILLIEENIIDNLGMSASDGSITLAQTQIEITATGNYLAAGLTGTVTVQSSSQVGRENFAHWEQAQNTFVANLVGTSSQKVLFYARQYEMMYQKLAPALRIFTWMEDDGVQNLDTNGLAIFDACIEACINPSLLGAVSSTALFVVADSGALTTAESEYKTRLENVHGSTVTVVSDSDAEDAGTYDYIIISGDVDTATLGTKYRDKATNQMLMKSSSHDELYYSASNGTTRAAQTAIYIADNTNFLTDHLTNLADNTISSGERLAGNTFPVSTASGATSLAAFSGDTLATSVCLFYVKQGNAMVTGNAPALRLSVPFYDGGTSNLNADGLLLFDKCIVALKDPSVLA